LSDSYFQYGVRTSFQLHAFSLFLEYLVASNFSGSGIALIGSTTVQSLTDLFAAFMDSAVENDDCILSHLVLHHNELWLLETVDDCLQDLCTSMPCHQFSQQDQIDAL
jgi:hypothetical protein